MRDAIWTVVMIVAVAAAFGLGHNLGSGPKPLPASLPAHTGWVDT